MSDFVNLTSYNLGFSLDCMTTWFHELGALLLKSNSNPWIQMLKSLALRGLPFIPIWPATSYEYMDLPRGSANHPEYVHLV